MSKIIKNDAAKPEYLAPETQLPAVGCPDRMTGDTLRAATMLIATANKAKARWETIAGVAGRGSEENIEQLRERLHHIWCNQHILGMEAKTMATMVISHKV